MAKLSNINGKFAVEDTGAIRFSDQTGTTGQILKSNGNAAPTWIPQSDIVGAYLPLAGGTLTGATATASGISFTVGGALTVSGTSALSGGLKVIGPGSYNTIRSGNDYILGLDDSNGTSQWWFKAYTNGGFALHENTVGDKFTIASGGAATFADSITATSASIPTMSVNTNFLGSIFQYGSTFRTSSFINLLNNRNTKKYLETAYFTNNVSNQAVNIQFPNVSMQGYYKITLSGSYSYQDISGKLTKVIPFGYNVNGSIWRTGNNQSEITIATGGVSTNFTIGNLAWDSTNSKFIIPIYKLTSTGNSVKILVEYLGGVANNLKDVTLSSNYTQSAPSPFNVRQYRNIRDRLGIATIFPVAKLDVAGDLRIDGYSTTTNEAGLYLFNNISYSMASLATCNSSYNAFRIRGRNAATNTLAIGSNGSENYVFQVVNDAGTVSGNISINPYGGNVGIGTSNPAQKFVIANATNGQGVEIIPGTTGTLQAYNRATSVYVPLNIDTLEARIRSVGATVFNNGASFATSESMRITSAGNVGIGTTSPQVPLQIGTHLTTAPADTGLCVSNRKSIRINDTDGNYAYGVYMKQNYSGSSYLILGTRHGAVDTDALFVKSGNVGINITSPKAKLDVDGDVNTTGSNANTLEFSTFFTGGSNQVIATLSSPAAGTTCVATIEYVALYNYGGTNIAAGVIMASTRYVASVGNTYEQVDDITISLSGNDTSLEPTLFWVDGINNENKLKINVGSSVQVTARVRITYHDSTLTRNYAA